MHVNSPESNFHSYLCLLAFSILVFFYSFLQILDPFFIRIMNSRKAVFSEGVLVNDRVSVSMFYVYIPNKYRFYKYFAIIKEKFL